MPFCVIPQLYKYLMILVSVFSTEMEVTVLEGYFLSLFITFLNLNIINDSCIVLKTLYTYL